MIVGDNDNGIVYQSFFFKAFKHVFHRVLEFKIAGNIALYRIRHVKALYFILVFVAHGITAPVIVGMAAD